jgi:4-hydroxymandelate oxidase
MSPHHLALTSRRRLLQFLAASPLFARSAFAEGLRPSDPADWAPRDLEKLIADPTQALDVFDFEPVMKKNVPPAHFGYMATGVDDEATLRANREGFRKFELRPRRLVDVSKIDMSAGILGTMYDSPIVLAPAGSNRAFHPDAEIAVAKATRAGNHLQILSTWPRHRSRMRSPRGAPRYGFSSTRHSTGKLGKVWSGEPRPRAHR